MQRIVTFLMLLTLGLALGGPADAAEPALAKRCNAIAWQVPSGTANDMPPALREIQRGLLARPPGALKSVLESLPHSLNVRRIAAPILASRPSDATRRTLLDLLQDKDEYVAREAANGLGSVGGREVIPSLRSAARTAKASVRHNAINALAQLGAQDEAVAVLLKAVWAAPEPVVCSALDALSNLRGRANQARAIERIERLLADDPQGNVGTRARAALRVLRVRLAP